MPRRERDYQPGLIKRIEKMFPGIIIRKHDIQQGWPDLLLLWGPNWAFLEVKREEPTSADDFEPNQPWWIEEFNNMSFAACIYPENEEEVLNALYKTFRARGKARLL